jgi:hypothetical protein
MPYSKCPLCGAVAHLSVGDVQRWYAEFYPGVPVGELVPGRCFDCWPELEAGMRVIVRPPLAGAVQVPVGARGMVREVVSAAGHGTIYLVHLQAGGSVTSSGQNCGRRAKAKPDLRRL